MQAFWHSSSHVLGEALEACFGVLLTIGPAIEEGFYYDCSMSGRSLTEAERPMLESKIKQARTWRAYPASMCKPAAPHQHPQPCLHHRPMEHAGSIARALGPPRSG